MPRVAHSIARHKGSRDEGRVQEKETYQDVSSEGRHETEGTASCRRRSRMTTLTSEKPPTAALSSARSSAVVSQRSKPAAA